MAVSQQQPVITPTADLPDGTWHVDPRASKLTFSSRGAFGLVAVHGSFGAYEGELHVDGRDVRGETFSPTALVPSADGALNLEGTLQIRDDQLRVQAPVRASRPTPDRLRLETRLSVDRAAAGVPWSKFGIVQGKAHLGASIVLVQI